MALSLSLFLSLQHAQACEAPLRTATPTEEETLEKTRLGAEEFRRTPVILHGRILSLRPGPDVGGKETQYLRIAVVDAIKGASPGEVLTVRRAVSECVDGNISAGESINLSAVFENGKLVAGGGGDSRLWRPYLAEVARTQDGLAEAPQAERALAMARFHLDNGDPRQAVAALPAARKDMPQTARAIFQARAMILMDQPGKALRRLGSLTSTPEVMALRREAEIAVRVRATRP